MNNLPKNPIHARQDMRNMILAVILTLAILVGWRFYMGVPQPIPVETAQQTPIANPLEANIGVTKPLILRKQPISREQQLASPARLKISSGALHGSVDLQGLHFDDLTLAKYHETLDKNSPEITLLTPRANNDGYFATFGWAGDGSVELPNEQTIWQTDATILTPNKPVTLHWQNPQNVRFEVEITLDDAYMFSIKQRVLNNSAQIVQVAPYNLINRTLNIEPEKQAIQHLGMLATHDNRLKELSYEDVREGEQKFDSTMRWLGITDKYWLSAIIPDANDLNNITGKMRYYSQEGDSRYQLELLHKPLVIAANATIETTVHFFAGAKESSLLDSYATKYDAIMFDRAVDFGVLYFLTRPLLLLLQWLYALLGNFGLAIMAVTVILKLFMFPLANKSYSSMAQMKLLMPKMQEIRDRFPDDKLRMNKEVMELYKREKINPASGCLPLLIQIPVFFALYKVLFIAIEMRHAPFYGWIKDLSVADPTNIFTAFGLLQWNAPSLLHIGVFPLLMSATMIIQQKMNPKPADPMQAQIIGYMPYVFVFVFAGFPAGLVLYWVWSNILSIAQQYFISRRYVKLYDKQTGKKLPAKK